MSRVTNEMISNQVIFNLNRNITRFFKLQNQMSTNRRINKASDDPIGTIRALSYRQRLLNIDQYRANIDIGQAWLSTTDSALNNINSAVTASIETAVGMANDTFDDLARQAAANEIKSLITQMLETGNTQLLGKSLFAGYKTKTKPFEKTAVGVVYRGDSGIIEYNVDSSSKVQVNTVGASLLTNPFKIIGENSDINIGVAANTSLAMLNNGSGVDTAPGQFTIKDENLNITATIDLSNPAIVTVQDAINEINTQLTAQGITSLTATLGSAGNNIKLDAVNSNLVNLTTPLANLNDGQGVDLQSGEFAIRDAGGTINVNIDISGDLSIGDVIDSINNQLTAAGVANVTAAINVAGTGIDINDTNGVPLDLYIEETSVQSNTASDLGILGNIDPTLNGGDLDPQPDFTIADTAPGETTAADLGILGKFNRVLVGTDLNPELQATNLLSDLNNGFGYSQGEIIIDHGDTSFTIDLSDASLVTVQDLLDRINNSGLDIIASINNNGTGIQIANNDGYRTLIIRDGDEQKSASAFDLAGSADVLGNLMLLQDALENNNPDLIRSLIDPLNKSLDHILTERAAVGAKSIRMETTLSRLYQFEVSYSKLLSEVEDADLTQVITDLAMQENAYTAALSAAAKILQPTLLDFIR